MMRLPKPLLLAVVSLVAFLWPSSVVGASDIYVSNATMTNMIFGSCHNDRKVQKNQTNIWKSIQKENPDIFVWMGDSVYPAQRKLANLTVLKRLYRNMLVNDTIGYNQLETKYGIYGTWDDHDFGANDGGREVPDRRERAALFYDFLNLPSLPDHLRERRGIYYSVTFGGDPTRRVKLIVLDTRWHRARHCFPSLATYVPSGAGFAAATRWILAGLDVNRWWPFWDCWNAPVLGEEQWEWLERELLQPDDDGAGPASVHVVVSSTQVLTTNPTVEGWGHFPHERKRLIQLLGRGISGLFLFSGDVHHGEILDPLASQSRQTTAASDGKNSFLEVTSSGMTHYCSQPRYGGMCKPLLEHYNRHRYASKDNYYIGRNYARLEIDWDRQQAEVMVKNEDGNIVLRTGARKFQQDVLTQEEIDRVVPCVDGHMVRPVLQVLVALMAVLLIGFRHYFVSTR